MYDLNHVWHSLVLCQGHSHCRAILSPSAGESLHSLTDSCPPSSQALATAILLSISINLIPLGTSHEWNYTVFIFL